MERLLKHIFRSFNIVTTIELGIGENTQYLDYASLSLTNLCRNDEWFRKYRFPKMDAVHYQCPLDIQTFFEYFDPRYDLAVVSCRRVDDFLVFFEFLSQIQVPYIASPYQLGTKRGYLERKWSDLSDPSNCCYFYFRDITEKWFQE